MGKNQNCYFVFCRNFCAPQCACTAVLRSPGVLGDRHLVTIPQGGGGPSSLGWGWTRGEGGVPTHWFRFG